MDPEEVKSSEGRPNWESLYRLEDTQVDLLREQIRKLQSETEQLNLLQDSARLDVSKRELDLAVAKIHHDREQYTRTEELAQNKFHYKYVFSSPVEERTVAACISTFMTWDHIDPEADFYLLFNSPGGSVVDGLFLFDYLRSLQPRHSLTTSTFGIAASIAAILLQAGSFRQMGREAWILVHQTSFAAQGNFGTVEDQMKWMTKVQDRFLGILAERSSMTVEEFGKNWERTDWWLSSDEAMELGLVDEIL